MTRAPALAPTRVPESIVVTADYFRDFGDRMTPAAIIPMHTPEEAIAELEYVTRELGSKVGMFGSGIRRPLPAAKGVDPEIARLASASVQRMIEIGTPGGGE